MSCYNAHFAIVYRAWALSMAVMGIVVLATIVAVSYFVIRSRR